MKKKLSILATKHHQRAHLYTIGKSVEGRDLTVISIAHESPDRHVLRRPELKFVANMHGDEVVGRELLLSLAHHLLENYGKTGFENITRLLRSSRVHLMPSLNPDGFHNSIEGICDAPVNEFYENSKTRRNGNNVDLNRNFPDISNLNSSELQPETEAVIEWNKRIPFILSANFHGGDLVVNYPYDNHPEGLNEYWKAPDDDVFRHISSEYANRNPAMLSGCNGTEEQTNKENTFKGGITNGAAWYSVKGGMQDYNYAVWGTLATTLEVSCCKYPKAEKLPMFWEHNRDSMIAYLLQGLTGFTICHDPFPKVEFKGRNIFHATEKGEFWRILLPGRYNITVSAKGYRPKDVVINVTKNKPLCSRDIALLPV